MPSRPDFGLFARALDWIWQPDPRGPQSALIRTARIIWCTAGEIGSGQLSLRAMSLVYTTLLSLVPLLALSFSMLKALGVHNRIEPALLQLFEPLGADAQKITDLLIGFVDNVRIGVLGSLGVALLFYAVLSMIQKVEASFNAIWHNSRPRPLGQRVSEYLVVLLVGPLAISLVFGMTASLMNSNVVEGLVSMQVMGKLLYVGGRLLPYLVMAGIFTFLFIFIPNTSVRVHAAATGGVVAGLMWQSANWGFASFVASASNYNAIYSGFAIMIFVLIWLYLGWLILLIGCQISFFVQHPEYLSRQRSVPRANPVQREHIAMLVMAVICERFRDGLPPLRSDALLREIDVRPELVNPIIEDLLSAGLLVEASGGELMPGRDPAHLPILELLNGVHRAEATGRDHRYPAISALSLRLAEARGKELKDMTTADLLKAQTRDDPA